MHNIDISIILLYLVICLVIGLFKYSKINNIKEYALGIKKFPLSVLIATLFATFIDSSMTIGIVEKVYIIGISFIFVQLIAPIFWIISAKIFSKRIGKFIGCVSISDIMEKLYGTSGKWITNVASLCISIGSIAIQISALSYMFEYFLGIERVIGSIVGAVIIISYSLLGGIRAVAMTDLFQFIIFFIAIPTACAEAYHDVGGYSGLINALPKSYLSIIPTKEHMLFVLSLFFFILIPDTRGIVIQRFLIAKDTVTLKKVLYITAALHFCLAIIICLSGLIIRAKSPDIDPNTAFLYMINHYLGTGLIGLMVAGMLAVIMSTADSWINTSSILCAHDIIKKIKPQISNQQELLIARVSSIFITALSIVLVLSQDSIFDLLCFVSNFWEPIIVIPLCAGFLGFQTNSKSFVIATISAICFASCSYYFIKEFGLTTLLFGMIGNALGLFISHCYFKFKSLKA